MRQTREGRIGNGIVVLDLDVEPETAYDALCDFQSYAQMIPTVRRAEPLEPQEQRPSTVGGPRWSYWLSKFMLNCKVQYRQCPEADQNGEQSIVCKMFQDDLAPGARVLEFDLDESSVNVV